MNTILTDDEIATAIAHLYAGPEVLAMALPDELHSARAVEAAVLAKLAQQEPVAWRYRFHTDASLIGGANTSKWGLIDAQPPSTAGDLEVEPLYAAPLPAVVQKAVAWVPVHPKTGPLWAMTTDSPDPERLPAYPLRSLYYTHPALAAAPEAPAQAAPSADEVERGDVVAFEFYNRATGHAIVDYSVNTHVGNLSADKGYEARPLVYADKREEVTDGSKPIPLWQAREALDELEAAARGDEPFNHFAAGLVRSALEQAAAPEAPAQAGAVDERDRKDAERYRFIRNADRSDPHLPYQALMAYACESFDEAIDDAMEEEVRAALAQKGGAS